METAIALSPEILPQANDIISIETSVANAEKYIVALDRIRKAALGMTNKLDWSNQGGKPYLEKSGCDKIAMAFGVKVASVEYQKEEIEDDKGKYILYSCVALGSWNNNTAIETGLCSTRDDFFGKNKPLSEVDITDIKKKAFTNCMNRLIKRLLGLSFTWEEIAEKTGNKITQETVATVSFAKGTKGGNIDSPQTKSDRDEIRRLMLTVTGGDETAAKNKLVELTAFVVDGKQVPGKQRVEQLSEKQVPRVLSALKKLAEGHEKAQSEAQPPLAY